MYASQTKRLCVRGAPGSDDTIVHQSTQPDATTATSDTSTSATTELTATSSSVAQKANKPSLDMAASDENNKPSSSTSASTSTTTTANTSHPALASTSTSILSSSSSTSAGPTPQTFPQSASSSSNASQPTSNNNPADGSSGVGNITSLSAVSMVTSDTEQDEIEMSRLQAILEARGVPSHLLGALGPRVQTLLHRTIGSSSTSKAHQLVQGLKAHGDEGQQLQTLMEMCQLLVMGNEDTLAGFPVKMTVPNLIQLLNMEHNFDIMNHACRALTYMMESLPRSASVVVDAVPSFLEKLQSIQCMDVAEQSLTALEMLSRRHSKAILHARGVPACLTYLDFFSINAQRSALTIAANCCQNITTEEFPFIQDSLVTLSSHLTSSDKKCVESIILAFSRLIEHYQNEPTILMKVAGDNLLDNLTQLLLATPSIVSINTFVMIIRMMALMCQNCPDLAVRLLNSDIIPTIRYLLVGQKSSGTSRTSIGGTQLANLSQADLMQTTINQSSTGINETFSSNSASTSSFSKLNESVELLNRTSQELYEITSLIAELMPRLPSDGLFQVNALLDKESCPPHEMTHWQWRDDRGIWHRYNNGDNKLIESAHRAGEEEVTIVTMGKTHTIDFTTMQQVNEETELSRPVQRKVNYLAAASHQSNLLEGTSSRSSSSSRHGEHHQHQAQQRQAQGMDSQPDPRVSYIKQYPAVLDQFVQTLFGVLYEIYSSSAGPSVRHECLSAFLRVVYYCPAETLRQLLRSHSVSSHIAGMLGSNDHRILVGAIQMAQILIEKLPDVFSVYFRREGVIHQMKRLAGKASPVDLATSSAVPSSSSGANKKESVRDWIVKQAQTFCATANSLNSGKAADDSQDPLNVLNKLTRAIQMLDVNMIEALRELKCILSDSDISSFELIHSGLVSRLVKLLTYVEGDNLEERDNRIRAFLSVFFGLPQDPRHLLLLLNEFELKVDPAPLSALVAKLNACISQLEQFPVRVHDFGGLGTGNTRGASALKFFNTHQLKCNLQRHPSCNNLRQWKGGPVKIDPLAVVQAIEKYLTVRGYAKVRDSAENSDDNSGDEMDDSMTMMAQPSGRHRLQLSIGDNVLPYNMTVYQAIRQFGGPSNLSNANTTNLSQLGASSGAAGPTTNNNDTEENDLQVMGHSNMWNETHTIYYRPYIEPHPGASTSTGLGSSTSMTSGIGASSGCQGKRASRSQTAAAAAAAAAAATATAAACLGGSSGASDLRLNLGHPYSQHQHANDSSGSRHPGATGTSSSSAVGGANSVSTAGSSGTGPASSSGTTTSGRRYNTRNSSTSLYSSHSFNRNPVVRKKADDLWTEGRTPPVQSPVDPYLNSKLPQSVTLKDPSIEIIVLLRAIFGLNRHWSWFYRDGISFITHQVIATNEFINTKLAAKATRQLQDPLVIMTGNLPNWLPQLAYACPFLVPFETRHLLFYVTCFDRDRALQRLLDNIPELSNSEERVAPRLERRKKTVNRDDLFRQAEIILNELTNSKTVLEVQYENEVGTGLGPTLEFYALVSREMQSAELEMWRGELVSASQSLIQPDPQASDQKQQQASGSLDHSILNEPWVDQDRPEKTGRARDIEGRCKGQGVSASRHHHNQETRNASHHHHNNNNVVPAYTKGGPTKYGGRTSAAAHVKAARISSSTAAPTNHQNTNSGPTAGGQLGAAGGAVGLGSSLGGIGQTVIAGHQHRPPTPPNSVSRIDQHHQQAQTKKYIYSPSGLFPIPLARNTKLGNVSRLRNRYKLLGKFMAKALMDSRMIDIQFSLPFYKWLLNQEASLDLADMAQIDPTMARTLFHMHRIAQLQKIALANKSSCATATTAKSIDKLRQQVGGVGSVGSGNHGAGTGSRSSGNMGLADTLSSCVGNDLFANISPEVLTLDGCPIEDLNLDFTLPGYSAIELKKGGKYLQTKLENLNQYVKLLRHWTLTEGVRRQMEAFRTGFETMIPLSSLRLFYPEELDSLFCGSAYQPWDVRMLMEACKTDHGFTHESVQIKYLFEILSSYKAEEQRKFLQFVTGSPRLPYGGLKGLSPPLTIVRKTLEPGQNPDHFLPSVMTCVNYLKLPEYSSCEIMREKMRISGDEGRNSFHLS